MSIKSIIKLFIPPIFYKIKYYLFNFKNIKKRGKYISTVNSIKKHSDKLIIIGNGPSLNESIKNYKEDIMRYDCMVVNHFCETEYYSLIKPQYYLLADPNFFGDINKYSDWQKERVNNFIEKLLKNTKWDIDLVVPSFAKESDFVSRISENKLIHILFFNNNNLYKFEDDYEKYKLWDENLIEVPAQTCLNSCIWLGVFLRYKEVYLIGADTNWIELLKIDQETNELYTIDKHFYGEKKRRIYKDVEGTVPVLLHEELFSNYYALKSYWELRGYAEYAGVKVYNASEYSLIDAFERKKIKK